jgi:hypothetical protein
MTTYPLHAALRAVNGDGVVLQATERLGPGIERQPAADVVGEWAPLALQAHKSNPRSTPLLDLPERGERYPCE